MFRKKVNSPQLPVQWIFVGLGNPGPEYRGTRHNIGFEVIDALAEAHRLKIDRAKHNARYCQADLEGFGVLLVKPLTFMNLSGQSVAAFARDFKVAPSNIVVIADDLDLKTGFTRMRLQGGHGGHNGHRNIIDKLGTQEYPRIRIGIGRGDEQTVNHVLGGFKPDERVAIEHAVKRAVEGCQRILTDGADRAMHWLNESNGSGA